MQLIEAQRDTECKDKIIAELRSACESSKAAELQADSMLQSLRHKVDEYQAAFGDVEGAAGRSELTIVTLQQQARESQQHIIELEGLHRWVCFCHLRELLLRYMFLYLNCDVFHDRCVSLVTELMHITGMTLCHLPSYGGGTRQC